MLEVFGWAAFQRNDLLKFVSQPSPKNIFSDSFCIEQSYLTFQSLFRSVLWVAKEIRQLSMERDEEFQQLLKLAENRLFLPDFEQDLKVPVRRLKRDSTDSVEQAR